MKSVVVVVEVLEALSRIVVAAAVIVGSARAVSVSIDVLMLVEVRVAGIVAVSFVSCCETRCEGGRRMDSVIAG